MRKKERKAISILFYTSQKMLFSQAALNILLVFFNFYKMKLQKASQSLGWCNFLKSLKQTDWQGHFEIIKWCIAVRWNQAKNNEGLLA